MSADRTQLATNLKRGLSMSYAGQPPSRSDTMIVEDVVSKAREAIREVGRTERRPGCRQLKLPPLHAEDGAWEQDEFSLWKRL